MHVKVFMNANKVVKIIIQSKNYQIQRKFMDKNFKNVNNEAWLICPNWPQLRRFIKNKNNKVKLSKCILLIVEFFSPWKNNPAFESKKGN